MQRFASYPVALERDGDRLYPAFRDIPEVVTWGRDEPDALEQAADALAVAIAGLMALGRDVPPPSSPRDGEHLVPLPVQLAAKLAVWRAFREAAISKAELARRMGLAEKKVRRILDPYHPTKLDRVAEAVRALGRRLVIGVE